MKRRLQRSSPTIPLAPKARLPAKLAVREAARRYKSRKATLDRDAVIGARKQSLHLELASLARPDRADVGRAVAPERRIVGIEDDGAGADLIVALGRHSPRHGVRRFDRTTFTPSHRSPDRIERSRSASFVPSRSIVCRIHPSGTLSSARPSAPTAPFFDPTGLLPCAPRAVPARWANLRPAKRAAFGAGDAAEDPGRHRGENSSTRPVAGCERKRSGPWPGPHAEARPRAEGAPSAEGRQYAEEE